jgi:hypothetical protein
MITAKNYAAQAENGLGWFCDFLRHLGHHEDAESVLATIDTINKSVKFCIEDNGRIFNDDLKALKGNRINLPFSKTCIEYYQHNTTGQEDYVIEDGFSAERMSKVVLVCADVEEVLLCVPSEISDSIVISMVLFFESDKRWQLSESGLCIKKDFFITGTGLRSFTSIPEYKKTCDKQLGKSGADVIDHMPGIKESMPYLKAAFEFLEALSCRNVEQSVYQEASPKNDQRIKSHKLPIYETKFLTIKQTVKEYSKNGTVTNHASPRQHLRRGHIRRLESGNIWVNSCVVGDSSKGVIDKQYKVH